MGVTTPTTATSVARPPTAIISFGVDSSPTWKSSSTAPSSASTVNVSLEARAESSGPPRSDGVPEGDPDEQLAEHGRLAESLDELAGQLGADEHEGQGQQDGRNGTGFTGAG